MNRMRWAGVIAVLATLVGVGGALTTLVAHLDGARTVTVVIVAGTVLATIAIGGQRGLGRTAYW